MKAFEARAAQSTEGRGLILLDSYGGAINRVAPSATAFVHRDALFSAQYLSYWDVPSAAAGNLAWLRSFYASMRLYASGYAYQNYIDPDLESWEHAYYGANLDRLRQIKKRYDPHERFTFAQGVRPLH